MRTRNGREANHADRDPRVFELQPVDPSIHGSAAKQSRSGLECGCHPGTSALDACFSELMETDRR
jgi:hypothetical protein